MSLFISNFDAREEFDGGKNQFQKSQSTKPPRPLTESRHARPQSRKFRRRKIFDLGLIGLVLLLATMEISIFRNIDFYGKSPGFIGQFAEIKASFEAADPERIKVAVLGDSQSMDALRPNYMAEGSLYAEEEIFNFSISGGSAFDIAETWDLYKDRMPELEKVIVIVNEHQFNHARAAEDIKFQYFANFGERLSVMNLDNYGELSLGWVLRAYGMRTIWSQMIDKHKQGELRSEIPVHKGGLPPQTWSPSTDRTPQYAEEVADRWFENYHTDGVRSDRFERMIRSLHSRDIQMVIVQLPRSEYFEEVILRKYPEELAAYNQLIQSIADQYDTEFVKMSNKDLDLETHFRDTNHVNPEGARAVSDEVSRRWLRE
jgi:hypothetical protein